MSGKSKFEHPDRIGPYHILQVIGEGGMGIVYEAEQKEPVRRRVAVKMMKIGMDTREVIGRFETERQALAVMDHTGIAKVLDAGATERGSPYFVMELVRGIRLDEYCDHRRLTVRQRVELFMDICRAVQHAHQKGVIHRDLKPSNVLVSDDGGRPTPKIIDFGVAKATGQRLTEQTVVTTYGQTMGTLTYMSPEQAEMSGLDVDTRADLYSLGVMLFELLAGTVPLDPKEIGAPAFLAQLVHGDLEMPTLSQRLATLERETLEILARQRGTDHRSLRKALSGDLQWIVQKAIEKDRSRRYETANDLALDLRRCLDDDVITARPPSPTYRLGKFIRRHRTHVAGATLATFALASGLVYAMRAERVARDAEVLARQEAATAREVSNFLEGLFEVSNPSESLGNSITAREILDRGAENVTADLSDQPLVQARMLLTIGKVYGSLGLYTDAVPLLERSLAIRERMPDAAPLDIGESHHQLGVVYRDQGRFEEADRHLQQALAIREHALGPNDLSLRGILTGLAASQMEQGHHEEAGGLFLRVLEIVEADPESGEEDLAMALGNLGAHYLALQRPTLAEPYIKRSLEIRERLLGPDDIDIGLDLNNLGVLYWETGDFESALGAYERARAIWEPALGPDHRRVGSVLNNLAETNWALGRYAEAEEFFLRSLAIKERTLVAGHPSTANSVNGLANVYRDQGRFEDAEPLYRRALAAREAALGGEHRLVAESLSDYATLLREVGRTTEAASLEARADTIRKAAADGN